MPITIGSNIASLQAQRKLADNTSRLTEVFERLSSGQRINKASDDAAGLAVSSELHTDRRVYTQGIRNLNDGLSILSIADGAISQLSSIVIRLEELAEQAASGTYGKEQRSAIDAEAQSLKDEYFRIAQSTEFNGRRLLTAGFGALRLQAGYGVDGGITSGLGGAVGNSAFEKGQALTTESTRSNGVALGDLNGDGVLDMVTAGSGGMDGKATIFFGAEDGTFSQARVLATESRESSAVALGDVNGDGALDIVTAGYTDSMAGEATVFLGAGDGTFSKAQTLATESQRSGDVTLGDLNGDGVLDMVTAGDGGPGQATVFLGTGGGTFSKLQTLTAESSLSTAVTLGDLNSDGVLDMVTAGDSGPGAATVFLGAGDGTFSKAQTLATESLVSYDVTLGDLNGDRVLDMVTAGDSGPGVATVFLGAGNGTFSKVQTLAAESVASYDVALGDLNGDGVLDMVTAGWAADGGKATVFLGAGDGTFGQARPVAAEAIMSMAVRLGDLNGDGVPDMVTAGAGFSGEASVFFSGTTSGVSPLLPFSLSTQADARQALPVFQRKLSQLAQQRGQIGAFQSRIEVAINAMQIARENFAATASRITDTDAAGDTAELIRIQILQKAASAVLSQANQQPALALSLLG